MSEARRRATPRAVLIAFSVPVVILVALNTSVYIYGAMTSSAPGALSSALGTLTFVGVIALSVVLWLVAMPLLRRRIIQKRFADAIVETGIRNAETTAQLVQLRTAFGTPALPRLFTIAVAPNGLTFWTGAFAGRKAFELPWSEIEGVEAGVSYEPGNGIDFAAIVLTLHQDGFRRKLSLVLRSGFVTQQEEEIAELATRIERLRVASAK